MKQVVITGPESSGKSTLATMLAQRLGGCVAPEFARPYLQALRMPYTYEDLRRIASGQEAWIQWYGQNTRSDILFFDTDWTVLRIWEQERFGAISLTAHHQPDPRALYLLCRPDLPWVADPLREHPQRREYLYTAYLKLLDQLGAQYRVIEGYGDTRLKNALDAIQHFF